MTKLPDKLSDLLKLAVKDSRAVARTPGHCLRMSSWLYFDSDGICYACMAGAVMLRTLKVVPSTVDKRPVGDEKLRAIDCMREGDFSEAFNWNHRNGETPTEVQKQAFLECKGLILEKLKDGLAPWSRYLRCAEILKGVRL